MKSRSTTTFAAVAIALSLFSGIAQARPGEGGSMGSRGSRTWSAPAPTRTSPYGAAPMERSIAPRYGMPGQSAPRYGNAPMMGQSRHPFLTGFMGGMLGAGVFGLLSGHGFLGGVHGLFGFVGLLLQIFLAVIVIRWLFALFTRNRNGGTGSAGAFPVGAGNSNGRTAPSTLQIGAQDYQAFQTLLLNIQAAWSQQNIPALQGMATPEMVSYFNQQLGALASRGERNVVSDVRFLQGDLAEAWTENGYDYATVAIRYSLIDLTTDMTGRVVAGSSTEPVVVTELWTFVRPSSGGAWLLSAIQQAR
ncbi:TIM44-like domain-containing protein [Acetobacter estunensis]|uniref:Tim44 domain-containing protein n=1 Tax=Acetobacter estunensis TaxID=104097 RepID=UPI001C2DA500|nr:TIM44-like domain-containing protein [Acetobacter estunensis]MBV1836548.1 TIM44-like domain-containing protein [Acetobacter estunensis]